MYTIQNYRSMQELRLSFQAPKAELYASMLDCATPNTVELLVDLQ